MKTVKNILLSMGVLLCACGKDDVSVELPQGPASVVLSSESPGVTVTEDGTNAEVRFHSEGGEAVVTVDASDRNWRVEAAEGWLQVERTPRSLILRAEPNATGLKRELCLRLASGSGENRAEAAVLVRQGRPGTELGLADNEILLGAVAPGPYILEIAVDGDTWNFRSVAEWLLVEKAGDTSLSLSALPNRSPAARSAEVSVYPDSDTTAAQTLIVTQKGGTQLMVDKSLFTFDETGGSREVTVTTEGQEWNASCPAPWVSLSRRGDVLAFSVAPNAEALRETEITLTAGSGDDAAVATVAVIQVSPDPEALVLRVEPVDFSYADGITAPSVVLNIGGTVDCTVNWGDGTEERVTSPHPHHTYPSAGVYYVTVTGKATSLSTAIIKEGYRRLITGIKSWGRTGLTSLSHAFEGTDITSIPDDTGGAFAEVTDFGYAFAGCALTEIPENLFRHAARAESFASTFSKCRGIKSIPPGIFDHTPAASDFSHTFAETGISSIPPGLFARCRDLREMNGTFYYCYYLNSIPEGIFDGCGEVESFDLTFAICSNLSSIPENIFAACPNSKSFNGTFSNCSGLTSLPEGLFFNCPKAVSFEQTFSNCSGIVSIPPALFSRNPEALSFFATFESCSKVTEIPEGIFTNNLRATNFSTTFSGMRGLTSIPEGLFRLHPDLTEFTATFANCSGLTSIPEGLFACNTKVTRFDRTFMVCTSLTSLPENLFRNNTAVTEFFGVFSSCSGLAAIPENLFARNTEALSFQNVFASCSGLESLPENLFANNLKATSMNGAFASCTRLRSIPEKLFFHNTEIWDFSSTFSGARSLTSVPSSMFDTNRKVGSFTFTFAQIPGLEGESPYTLVEGRKVHLYERSLYPSEFNTPGGVRCFYRDTRLSDYAQIPDDWKM